MKNDKEDNKMSLEEAGRKGGQARADKYSDDELSEQAKRAAATVERKHPGFHAEIGAKGGQARSERGQKGDSSQEENSEEDENKSKRQAR